MVLEVDDGGETSINFGLITNLLPMLSISLLNFSKVTIPWIIQGSGTDTEKEEKNKSKRKAKGKQNEVAKWAKREAKGRYKEQEKWRKRKAKEKQNEVAK